MVTYFNRKDLVSFGSYLLSEERKSLVIANAKRVAEENGQPPAADEDILKDVYHADVENWLHKQRNPAGD